MCVFNAYIGLLVCATNVRSTSQAPAMMVVVLVSEQVFKVLWTFGHIERNRNEMYHICPTAMNYKPNRIWRKRPNCSEKFTVFSLLIVQSHGNIIRKWLLWFKQIPEKWNFCRFQRFFSIPPYVRWLHTKYHLTFEIKSSFIIPPSLSKSAGIGFERNKNYHGDN